MGKPVGFANLSTSARKVVVNYGIPEMDLRRELAEFYLLENLATVRGNRQADKMLRVKERFLAEAFARYFDMIIGGELRHWPAQNGCDYCNGDGECYDCYGSGESSCDECYGEGRKMCYDCDGDGWVYCPECDGSEQVSCWQADCENEDCDESHACTYDGCDGGRLECGTCDGEGYSECYECDGTGEAECYSCGGSGHYECDYCGGSTVGTVTPDDSPIHKWLDSVHHPTAQTKLSKRGKRHFAWSEWKAFRKKHGIAALDWAVDAFENGGWNHGYGGEAWATIARLTRDYRKGKIGARIFVNMAWSVQHNGGCAFDKAFQIVGDYRGYTWEWQLQDLLNWQAESKYDRLSKYASPIVKDLWFEATYRAVRQVFSPEWLGVQDTTDRHEAVEPVAPADIIFERMLSRRPDVA